MPTPKPSQPTPCAAARCACCRYTDERGEHVRPLTPADLMWQFQEAEAALGIRSTHGAFVDMAQAGPPTGGGGRTNGTEERMARVVKLNGEAGFDPIARHRCIRSRLAPVAPSTMAVLETAFRPDDWARSIVDPDVRHAVEHALRAVPVEVAKILPLTAAPLAHAARRQAAGYQAPPAKKPRPSDPGHTPSPAERLRKHLAEQPGLAGTAVGHVLAVLLGGDAKAITSLVTAGRHLLEDARIAASVTDPPRRARTRSVQLLPAAARPMLASEAADV